MTEEPEPSVRTAVAMEIDDDYEHIYDQDAVEYILESIPFELEQQSSEEQQCQQERSHAASEYQILNELFNSVLINSCDCCSNTNENENSIAFHSSPSSEDSENPFTQCTAQSSLCSHGGNYKFNKTENQSQNKTNTNRQQLVLQNANNGSLPRPSGDLIYECSTMCKCEAEKCQNRLVQNGPRKNLKIINSQQFLSSGLITTAAIPTGGFICEYAGELLTRTESRRRIANNEKNNKMNYILCLNEYSAASRHDDDDGAPTQTTIVDPSRKGNIGRYLNHSCDPNCELFSVRIDCPIPNIGIFAKKDISAGEELCFHYGGGCGIQRRKLSTTEAASAINSKSVSANVRATPCLCGASNCEKFMPSIEF